MEKAEPEFQEKEALKVRDDIILIVKTVLAVSLIWIILTLIFSIF